MEIKITIEGLDQLTESLALIGSALAFQRGMAATSKAAVELLNELTETPLEVPTIEEQKEVVKEKEVVAEKVAEAKDVKTNITIEDIRAAFMAKNSKGNTPKLKGLLKDFNVAKVTDLEEEHFVEVLARLEAI